MIASPAVVSQLLSGTIALLAIALAVLQLFPSVHNISSGGPERPIRELLHEAGIRRSLQYLKISILFLASSVLVGVAYLAVAAGSTSLWEVSRVYDYSLIFSGLALLAVAVAMLLAVAAVLSVDALLERPPVSRK